MIKKNVESKRPNGKARILLNCAIPQRYSLQPAWYVYDKEKLVKINLKHASLMHEDLRSTTFQVFSDFLGIFIIKSANFLVKSSITFIDIRDFIVIFNLFAT